MTPSRIQRLSRAHFRNFRAASVQARGDVVVLVGPNGAGKTNSLEAISFLSPGRGLRRARLEDVADNQGDGSWAVSAEVEGALGLATLGTGIDAPAGAEAASTRRCRIDREPVNSATAFGDHLRMVWLTPALDGLFLGAASAFPSAQIMLDGWMETALLTEPATSVEDRYREILRATRARDAAAGRTLDGPHLTDFEVTYAPKQMPAADASTGEQKALLI